MKALATIRTRTAFTKSSGRPFTRRKSRLRSQRPLPLHKRGKELVAALNGGRIAPSYLRLSHGLVKDLQDFKQGQRDWNPKWHLDPGHFEPLLQAHQDLQSGNITAEQFALIHMACLILGKRLNSNYPSPTFEDQLKITDAEYSNIPQKYKPLLDQVRPKPGTIASFGSLGDYVDFTSRPLFAYTNPLTPILVGGEISVREILAYSLFYYSILGLPTEEVDVHYHEHSPLDLFKHDEKHSGDRFKIAVDIYDLIYETTAVLDFIIPSSRHIQCVDDFLHEAADGWIKSIDTYSKRIRRILYELQKNDPPLFRRFKIGLRHRLLPLLDEKKQKALCESLREYLV